MGNPVVHFEIIAKDGKKLQQFYSQAFGWKIDANNPMNYGLVDTAGGAGIGGGIGQTDGQMPQYVTFYIQVKDLQSSLATAQKLGATMVVPPTEIPNMVTFAMFKDPEGNLVGLVKE